MHWIDWQYLAKFLVELSYTIDSERRNSKMKKQLLASFCGLFLLAAPIQMASASTTTPGEVTNTTAYVKQCTLSTVKTTSTIWKLRNGQMVKVPTQINKKVYTCKFVPAKQATLPAQQVTTQAPSVTQPSTTPVQETVKPTTVVSGIHDYEQQVLTLTNAERAKQGLAPLQADTKLMAAAREKSEDMQKNNYFSHTSPTFGSPFDRLKALGISYKAAGENIAKGQRTPAQVVQAWMDSPGHRANILNDKYTHLGVGFVENGFIGHNSLSKITIKKLYRNIRFLYSFLLFIHLHKVDSI